MKRDHTHISNSKQNIKDIHIECEIERETGENQINRYRKQQQNNTYNSQLKQSTAQENKKKRKKRVIFS